MNIICYTFIVSSSVPQKTWLAWGKKKSLQSDCFNLGSHNFILHCLIRQIPHGLWLCLSIGVPVTRVLRSRSDANAGFVRNAPRTRDQCIKSPPLSCKHYLNPAFRPKKGIQLKLPQQCLLLLKQSWAKVSIVFILIRMDEKSFLSEPQR